MPRYDDTLEATIKRIFGPAARLTGTVGTMKRPGEIRIILDRRMLGIGPTFAMALQDAQRQVRKEHLAV